MCTSKCTVAFCPVCWTRNISLTLRNCMLAGTPRSEGGRPRGSCRSRSAPKWTEYVQIEPQRCYTCLRDRLDEALAGGRPDVGGEAPRAGRADQHQRFHQLEDAVEAINADLVVWEAERWADARDRREMVRWDGTRVPFPGLSGRLRIREREAE